MSQSTLSTILTAALQPTPQIIFSVLAIVLILPVLVHIALYRSSTKKSALPIFLLTGPSGSGKTSLQLLIERGILAQTHTSQSPLSISAALPLSIEAKSDQYRSEADPHRKVAKKFQLVDTPGHGKLRHFAQEYLSKSQQLKGVIFVVDAADLSPDSTALRETSEWLYDVLLTLQKGMMSKSAKRKVVLPVLIAANKADLFTALPAALVRKTLERELTGIRESRSKGLFVSGVNADQALDFERDWLGETGEGAFEFEQMLEFNVEVAVAGGSIHGTERPDIVEYWKWLAESL